MNAYEQMRDALVAMVDAETEGSMERDDLCGRCLSKMWNDCKHDGSCWVDKVMNALALPRRQCDVGTAEVQLARMSAWCRAHQDTGEIIHCRRCPIKSDNYFLCALRWAQMPYDESEAK